MKKYTLTVAAAHDRLFHRSRRAHPGVRTLAVSWDGTELVMGMMGSTLVCLRRE